MGGLGKALWGVGGRGSAKGHQAVLLGATGQQDAEQLVVVGLEGAAARRKGPTAVRQLKSPLVVPRGHVNLGGVWVWVWVWVWVCVCVCVSGWEGVRECGSVQACWERRGERKCLARGAGAETHYLAPHPLGT